MTKKTLYLSYIYLSPGLENPFQGITHRPLLSRLRSCFPKWLQFEEKFSGLDLGLIIAMKRGTSELSIKGPTRTRASNAIDFTIFLPDRVSNKSPFSNLEVRAYLELVLFGISQIIGTYDEANSNLNRLPDEILSEIRLGQENESA